MDASPSPEVLAKALRKILAAVVGSGFKAAAVPVLPAETAPPWNPLMYDSIGQFYPWRSYAGASISHGSIPLWNPYQFCGAPFLANSQSAVLYPGNLLFYILPTKAAAGWINARACVSFNPFALSFVAIVRAAIWLTGS